MEVRVTARDGGVVVFPSGAVAHVPVLREMCSAATGDGVPVAVDVPIAHAALEGAAAWSELCAAGRDPRAALARRGLRALAQLLVGANFLGMQDAEAAATRAIARAVVRMSPHDIARAYGTSSACASADETAAMVDKYAFLRPITETGKDAEETAPKRRGAARD